MLKRIQFECFIIGQFIKGIWVMFKLKRSFRLMFNMLSITYKYSYYCYDGTTKKVSYYEYIRNFWIDRGYLRD